MIPQATMRLQFHRNFTFADARRHVGWIADLGISHVYASPIAAARAGSMHGYDVVDPTVVSPELGGESALRDFAGAASQAGLGLILDIVPNHLAADAGNPWWRDVLKRGRASPYAAWFDIDWSAGKVLLPILGQPLEETIAAGELSVDCTGNAPVLRYFAHELPLADDSVTDRGSVANLLARQHYRLESWRVAGDRINWRRFFDINELVCLRMEDPAAFEAVHALPLRLYAEGLIDGLRIDHVDGLTDPAGYCQALRSRLDAVAERTGRSRAWLVVEKILLKDEVLPQDWGVDGTSGYDFMNEVSALQHAADAEPVLATLWHETTGRPSRFEPEEELARREIVARSFQAQLDACAAAWEAVLAGAVPRPALRRLLSEVLVHFPVYRTYAALKEGKPFLSDTDRAVLRTVISHARRSCLATDRWALERLEVAMLEPPTVDTSHAGRQWSRAMARLQQLSAPVAAKAVEDTAFYRFGRLLSRNDVGFDAGTFALAPSDFHARMMRRATAWPGTMLTTATHDHKRGEDVRARLAALSEAAGEWTTLLAVWLEELKSLQTEIDGRPAPTAGDIVMLLQTIIGAWPPDFAVDDVAARRALAERLAAWQEKALREAKLVSDWAAPDAAYEDAARNFVMNLLVERAAPAALAGLASLAEAISPSGAVNGLTQCLLRCTVPGVPDLYQGCDLWDLSLVDPDNRRPVDFAGRAASATASLRDLATSWRDGRIKRHVIRQALQLRRRAPGLFRDGDYRPLAVHGDAADKIVAFTRRAGDSWMLVLAPRLVSRDLGPEGLHLTAGTWKGAELVVDDPPPVAPLYDWLGGGIVELLHARVRPDFLCGPIPMALVSNVPPAAV